MYHGLRHVMWVVRHVVTLCGEVTDERHRRDRRCRLLPRRRLRPHPRRQRGSQRSRSPLPASPSSVGTTTARARSPVSVRTTQRHLPGDDDTDAMVLCDADLAVLGTSPKDYVAYTNGVRREYRHVDDDAWRTGRAHVLGAFLSRDSIYQHDTRDRPLGGTGARQHHERAGRAALTVSAGGGDDRRRARGAGCGWGRRVADAPMKPTVPIRPIVVPTTTVHIVNSVHEDRRSVPSRDREKWTIRNVWQSS
ncbi:MAG: hypothetical protein WKF58_17100 [Ilumatobacteraceae bacterium]